MTTKSHKLYPYLALLFTLLLAACSRGAGPSEPTSGPSEPTSPPAAAVTLLKLENGDRACYVVVKTDDGAEESLEGGFELCEGGQRDATPLIGRKITYTTKKANVLAASCEGDMDCGETDEVDLVVSITPAD